MMQNNSHPLLRPFWLLNLRRSPKSEEQRVPHTLEGKILDEFQRIWGIEDRDEANCTLIEDQDPSPTQNEGWSYLQTTEAGSSIPRLEADSIGIIKTESFGFWNNIEEEKKVSSLNLNLNHEDLPEAWSNRGSPSCSSHTNTQFFSADSNFMGEAPVKEEEERAMRRAASVMRYKEKRQSRRFSKKIRYQVRKLNADKRPRFKGRFVKRNSNAGANNKRC